MPKFAVALLLFVCLTHVSAEEIEVVHSEPPRLQDSEAAAAISYLEIKPRGEMAHGLRTLLLRWLQSSTKFSVIVCQSVLAPVPDDSVPNAAELLGQFMFANAAHQVEHPEDRDEMLPNQIAGLHSMLRMYTALLASDPRARIARFDALLQAEQEGRLAVEIEPLLKQDCRAVISHD
jgi:hypothetical protein